MPILRKEPAIIFFLTAFLAIALSCSRHSEAWDKMNLAESLMESQPDSALNILNQILSSTLVSEEETARFALLKSMALDKNYVDTTTFDILQPAIDYYAKHGSADDRFRTDYYRGRIFQNQKKDEAALQQFMKANDYRNEVSDTLTIARNLVAMGAIYAQQYRMDKFTENNLEAARLYGSVHKEVSEIRSYAKALYGYTMLEDKERADSVMDLCYQLVERNPEYQYLMHQSFLSYTIQFGSKEEISSLLKGLHDIEESQDEMLDIARAYTKIGEYDKALAVASNVAMEGTLLDSLKHITILADIYKGRGDYEKALGLYEEYTSLHESYLQRLLSQDLFFAEQKHRLEVDNLIKIQEKNKIIWLVLCGAMALLILSGSLYYRYRLDRTKKIIAEKDNENLRLQQENLIKENEKIALERDNEALLAANLLRERDKLEGERDSLKNILKGHEELTATIKEVITTRLSVLHSLLAKEISNNDNYAKPYAKFIESIHKDKEEFMNSTRLAFSVSSPAFIEYLKKHGLTTDEINYVCLYAIGLRGKEIGEYIQVKGHYNISSEIRKKLGIGEHDTNLGLYIRKKLKELQ